MPHVTHVTHVASRSFRLDEGGRNFDRDEGLFPRRVKLSLQPGAQCGHAGQSRLRGHLRRRQEQCTRLMAHA